MHGEQGPVAVGQIWAFPHVLGRAANAIERVRNVFVAIVRARACLSISEIEPVDDAGPTQSLKLVQHAAVHIAG